MTLNTLSWDDILLTIFKLFYTSNIEYKWKTCTALPFKHKVYYQSNLKVCHYIGTCVSGIIS